MLPNAASLKEEFNNLIQNNEYVQKGITKNVVVAFIDESSIIIQRGKTRSVLMALTEIPESMKKTSDYYIDSLLAAGLALFLFGITPEKIKTTILNLK